MSSRPREVIPCSFNIVDRNLQARVIIVLRDLAAQHRLQEVPQVSGSSPDIDGFPYHGRRPNQIDTRLNFVERMHARIKIVDQSAQDGLIRWLYHPRRGWIISVGNRVEYQV